ncbi:MauE/DoxX family redox-associated membrane protein [Marinobacter sp. 2_MG-2023]|uniref:MauE/DoxX family redox-associated membrane protein n=1 Tax=Marinobacter sp. 2_MG-2023 TaxID=3062679 RepID=UPI0026E27A20|nr:MauE/DoxX family redox-associated membrane protein [Marinobacter sp. 2_MG-2023]MDO6442736.1 MauE/DoxX family redox-associated membrane protein [Marinobacter sp. 2_MG-2023]
MMIDPIISTAAALALSVIFASAASHKLRHPGWFRRQVQEYELVPGLTVPIVATALPLAELTIAVGLLWSISRPYAAALAFILIAAYTLAIAINLARGRKDIDCGCSGPAMRQPLQPALFARNLLLAVMALCALLPMLDRSLSLHDSFVMIAAGTVLILLYTATDLWLANRPLLLKMSGEK